MLISDALAAHPQTAGTGSSGGANALLIILGVFIFLGFVYYLQKRLRRRLAERQEGEQ
jgi:Kef-type K+ transport system membrane component KefB